MKHHGVVLKIMDVYLDILELQTKYAEITLVLVFMQQLKHI